MMFEEDDPHESLYKKKEVIKMEVMKIPEIEKKLIRLENEVIIMNKRIKKLQEEKK